MDHLTDQDTNHLLETAKIGEFNEPLVVTTMEQNRLACLNMARQAVHTLHIYSQDLDPAIYSNREFVAAVTRLAVSSKHARIEILVRDTNPIIQHGHMLIETMRKLSSYIQMRKVCEEHMDFTQGFFIADERALVLRKVVTRFEGVVKFNAAMECRELLKTFREVWLKSEPDPKLRRLHL